MRSVPIEVLRADRARWLADLLGVLSEAQQLLVELELPLRQSEGRELYQSIEAARSEVRSLQLSRIADRREEKCPDWTEFALWRRATRETC